MKSERLPEFITFTGLDARTDLARCHRIAGRYPVEWGVLFSATRQGVCRRYPPVGVIENVLKYGMTLAAHLCGQYAREVMAGGDVSAPVRMFWFERVQVNHHEPDPVVIGRFAEKCGSAGIAQTSADQFPQAAGVDWLFDRSGGRGVAPPAWPPHPGEGQFVGYAGGICPANVVQVIADIGSTGPYWLDMESGVRDSEDWLDLDMVEEVCRQVYGERP